MNESQRKSQLVHELRLSFSTYVVIRHEDHFTGGIPDISITNGNREPSTILWLEVKYGKLKTTGLQREMLCKLGGFYVVYGRDTMTRVLTPSEDLIVEGKLHLPVINFVRLYFTGCL